MTKGNMSIFSAAERKIVHLEKKEKRMTTRSKCASCLPSSLVAPTSGMLARKTQLTFRIAKTVHF